ncbi:MAG: hypothetical protein AAGJ81_13400 [Verrucomicrobiota bacterium]
MVRILLACSLALSLLSGCAGFRKNLNESREDRTSSGLDAIQEDTVDDFAEGGQLNPSEEAAMKESISGSFE